MFDSFSFHHDLWTPIDFSVVVRNPALTDGCDNTRGIRSLALSVQCVLEGKRGHDVCARGKAAATLASGFCVDCLVDVALRRSYDRNTRPLVIFNYRRHWKIVRSKPFLLVCMLILVRLLLLPVLFRLLGC